MPGALLGFSFLINSPTSLWDMGVLDACASKGLFLGMGLSPRKVLMASVLLWQGYLCKGFHRSF